MDLMDLKPIEGELLEARPRAAALVWRPHPLTLEGRMVRFEAPRPGEYLDDYLTRLEVDLSGPVKIFAGDIEIPRDWWHRVKPKPGSTLRVFAVVEGGDDSNPLAIVALLAIAVAAPYLVNFAAGGFASSAWVGAGSGWLAGAGVMGTVAVAAVTMAGSMLVNALFPPPRPQLGRASSSAADSPTYSLAGGANRARPYEPLALVLGTHRVFFDYAARPYSVFQGEDQYLFQLFHVALSGPYGLTVADLKIGDTSIADFVGVETWYAEGSIPGNFPTNVDTLNGGQLKQADGWMTRTSSLDTTRLEIDVQAMLMHVGENGMEAARVDFEASYRAVGGDNWQPIIYDRIPNYYSHYWSAGHWGPADESGNQLWVQVDYGSVNAGDHVEGAAYDAENIWRWRAYDEPVGLGSLFTGPPVSDPAPDRSLTSFTTTYFLEGASRNPIRRTWGVDVPAGQYEVRMRRTSADSTDTSTTSDLYWTSLKSYQTQPGYYAGQAFLAVKIKASGQLNGTLDRLSGTVAMRIGDGVLSSNPADLFAFYALGHTVDGRLLWGGGLLSGDLDTAALAAWRAFCVAHALTCDLVIDQQKSVWDILQAIARCGRASPSWATGKLGVVWDAGGQPVVAQFGMANIRRGSFRVEYASIDPVEEVVLNFVNAEKGWETDQVRALKPGVTSPSKTAMIELWGCVHGDMAQKECNLALAENLYRTRRVYWETDAEGLVVGRGDVVSLAHDLTNWGQSGRLVAVADVLHLVLDQAITLTPAGTWIGIIRPDGSYTTHRVEAGAGGSSDTITLLDPLALTPASDGSLPVDWRYVADVKATPGKMVKLVEVVPVDMYTVRLTAVDEDPAYYAAEGGTYAAPVVTPWTSSAPAIYGLSASENIVPAGASFAVWLVLTWRESGDVAARRIQVLQDGVWRDAGFATSSRFELPMPDSGSVTVGVTLYDSSGQTNSAAQASLAHTLAGVTVVPLLPIINATGGIVSVDLAWSWPSGRADLQYIEFQVGADAIFANSAALAKLPYPATTYSHTGLVPETTFYYWGRVVDSSGNAGDWAGPVSATSLSVAWGLVDGDIDQTVLSLGLQEEIAKITPIETVIYTAGPPDMPNGLVAAVQTQNADIGQLNDAGQELAAAVLQAAIKTQEITDILHDAGVVVDPNTGSVSIYALEQTQDRVTNAEIRLDSAEATISTKVTMTEVNGAIAAAQLNPTELAALTDLNVRVTTVETNLDAANASLTQKASLTELQTAEGRITTAETDIDALQAQIVNKVENTTFDGLDARVSTAELTISALDVPSITQAVQDTRYLADQQDLDAQTALMNILNGQAQLNGSQAALAAARQDLTAYVDEGLAAEAALRVSLAAQVAANAASLTAEQTARADADTAEAAARTALAATVTSNYNTLASSITTEQTARAAADAAEASARTDLAATVTANYSTLNAAISTEQSARVAADAAEVTARQALAATVTSNYNTLNAAISTEQTARADADTAEATARTALAATVASNYATLNAGLSNEITARASADAAEITARETLAATVTTNYNTLNAAISTEQSARATADAANVDAINTLSATVVDNYNALNAAIQTEQNTRADADSANASAITILQAKVFNPSSGNSALLAAIQTEETVRAQGDAANASSITTLQTTVNGHTTSIQTQQESIDGIQGKYSVKIDNSGYVVGFGLISSANNGTPTGEFSIVADRFSLAPVATNPNAVDGSPFYVLTAPQVIDGVTVPAGTYIKTAFIADATITAAKIKDGTITNAEIANGAITSANIQNAAITTAKIGDLQVDTIKVKDGSISNTSAASTGGGIAGTGAYVQVLSTNLVISGTSGGPIGISAHGICNLLAASGGAASVGGYLRITGPGISGEYSGGLVGLSLNAGYSGVLSTAATFFVWQDGTYTVSLYVQAPSNYVTGATYVSASGLKK